MNKLYNIGMKKIISFNLCLVLLTLCGCAGSQENKDTRFLLDTVVTVTAKCNLKVLNGVFDLCEDYEKKLSSTDTSSEVYALNNADGFFEVSDDTLEILKKSIYYGQISNGKFDITIYPVSSLWNFNSDVVPSRDEISEALKNVDYQSIEITDNGVCLHGKQIDFGGIAKGYIADRMFEYLKQNGVTEGILDLGGNITVFGDRYYTVGIKKPFSQDELSAKVKVRNKSIVTSGIYERCIKKDDTLYHHILNPQTGYACDTDLYSATIIGDSAFDADALSTVCILEGLENAKKIIENTFGTEAIFVDNGQNLHYTSGLTLKDGVFTLKQD